MKEQNSQEPNPKNDFSERRKYIELSKQVMDLENVLEAKKQEVAMLREISEHVRRSKFAGQKLRLVKSKKP